MLAAPSVRPAAAADRDTLRRLAIDNGLFEPEAMGDFDAMLAGYLDGSLDGHAWIVAEDADHHPVGAAYYAPEPFSDRMWNLYFLAVDPGRHRAGAGRALVAFVESDLAARGDAVARTLIVETSGLDGYASARRFYERCGFVEEARIRDFYGPGDAKVVFWKALAATPS